MSRNYFHILRIFRRAVPALLFFCTALSTSALAQEQELDYKAISIDSLHRRALVQQHQNKGKDAFESLEHAARASEQQEDLRELIDTYHLFAIFQMETGE